MMINGARGNRWGGGGGGHNITSCSSLTVVRSTAHPKMMQEWMVRWLDCQRKSSHSSGSFAAGPTLLMVIDGMG